ncbi:MAG: DUF4238 domain-containing protein [Pseudomonadota bacterium]|nr:DUF4238 domain-containing protein [Pseudomonadota bacterium]
MKKFARNHHFVPQGYLAGFTGDGTREGQLFVSDLVSRLVFQTKPRNVGAERDFNRIEADGHDPDTLERQLGEFEGRAISVIRGIQASGELPADEELSYVVNLMALLVVRNPKSRRAMNTARRHTVRVIGDMLTSDRRLFEHHFAKAKGDGFIRQDAEVSFEAMRKFIEDDQYTVTVSTSESLSLEFGGFENALGLLGSRYWSLVTAATDAPDFVTCDHPVTPVFKDPERGGPIGYGLPQTEVSFPLNTRQALLGVLEDPLQPRLEARTEQVAAINSRTVYHADRQVYSKMASVVVLRSGGLSSLN